MRDKTGFPLNNPEILTPELNLNTRSISAERNRSITILLYYEIYFHCVSLTMSKYKNLRPAGLSDDDDDDDFFDKHYHSATKDSRDSRKTENDFDDVLVHEEDHENYLINACTKGDLKAIQDHLENVTYDINKFLHTGWTLLLYAASSVQPEIIEYLLTFDVDPNKDKEGFTPLMALCSSTKGTAEISLKCLIMLIQAKADANLTNRRRETALMYACTSQNAEFVAELIKHVHDINVCDSDGKSVSFNQ